MQKTRTGRWQVRWREKGVQRAKSFPNKERAKKFEAELMLGEADTRPNDSLISFARYAERWHKEYCVIHKSESQWPKDLYTIQNHLNPILGDVPLAHLTKSDFYDVRADLITVKGMQPKSVNNITSLARKILATAVEMDLLRSNPFQGTKPLKVPPQPFNYWTIDERDRFLTFCKREDFSLWEVAVLACHTGMRMGEISALTRRALDFERRAIIVFQAYSHTLKKVISHTKGKNIRQIIMNDAVYEILQDKRLLQPTALIFPKGIDHGARKVRRIAKLAGVKAIRFHDLRHTFASCLAMEGVSVQKIQALLGHVDIKETMRYSHLHPSSLEGVTDVLVRSLCVREKVSLQDTDIKVESGGG